MIKLVIRAIGAGEAVGFIWMFFTVCAHVLKSSSIFTVRVVEVKGVSHTDKNRLEKVYQPYVGKNIFEEIAPDSLMTEDPWVIRLEMKRVIPDKLLVVVEEEKELLTYKSGGKCMTRTERGLDIAVGCGDVKVFIVEAGVEEFNKFTQLYHDNEVLKNNPVTLKNGFFWVQEEDTILVGNFEDGVFMSNYEEYLNKIKPRYKTVKQVDMTVKGKVYVKGVLNG